MIKQTPEKYKIELDEELMSNLIILIDNANNPFMPLELWRFSRQLHDIIEDGCFKHNILRENIKTSTNTSTTLCRLCNPKEYKKLKELKEKQ